MDDYGDDPTGLDRPFERALPNSAEAERAVLGAIILVSSLIFQAIELLKPEDFYVPSHRYIFKAMIALFEAGKDIDPILIGEELKKEGQFEAVGGISFITNLTFGLPHSTSIANYAKLISDYAKLRELFKATHAIAEDITAQEDDASIIIARAEQKVFDISSERYKGSLVKASSILEEVIEDGHHNIGLGLTADGLDTGFTELNQLTSGLQKGDLVIVAARPGMGKTSFGQCLLDNVAIRGQKLSAFFSLEMRKKAVLARALCAEARVDHQRYRNGFLNHEEWDKITAAQVLFDTAPLYLDDTPGISVLELKAKALRLMAELKTDLALIVADFLQLMAGTSERRRESRQQEVAGIARDLKKVARELNVPLVALAQLSRAPEGRQDKRPIISDLRESGEIEQVADVVGFLYREAQYVSNLSEENKNLAELIIAKQRNGPTGTVVLRFEGRSFRFDNLHHESQHNF